MVVYTEKLYQALYRFPDESGEGAFLPYCRKAFEQSDFGMFERRARYLEDTLSINENDKVLLVGAGFGFLAERMSKGVITCIDSSPYIQANLDDNAIVPIASLMVEDAAIMPEFSGVFDWVISEDAISAYEQHEAADFAQACESCLHIDRPAANVVHLVTPIADWPGDSSLTWLTLQEWQSVNPEHTWIDPRSVYRA